MNSPSSILIKNNCLLPIGYITTNYVTTTANYPSLFVNFNTPPRLTMLFINVEPSLIDSTKINSHGTALVYIYIYI